MSNSDVGFQWKADRARGKDASTPENVPIERDSARLRLYLIAMRIAMARTCTSRLEGS